MAKVEQLVQQLSDALRQHSWRISTAESCTGGKIAAAITDLAGSSDVFDVGWVTYSNAAKQQQLHVPAALLAQYGAVSEEVARAMAEGAAAGSGAEMAVAVTGVAGPGGGSAEKPVGTVWLAWHCQGRTYAEKQVFPGNRKEIREATVVRSLEKALTLLR
ncbi:MAG TPA: CinA family protein [Alcanivoracaceae bacterium]|nr:CinA family protein [Alcanivoracaceae bacterium]